MTATLRFRLPDDRYEYECAYRGADYRSALDEIGEWLRRKVKYAEIPECAKAAFTEASEALWSIRSDHGLEDE